MVKEKQTRTYDRDGYRRRAACLCVRSADESEILLVTSSRMTDHWIVPGGGVEPNEDASEAAIRETEEEAGVRGVIKRCLGDFEVCDEKRERKHRTSVYVLQVGEELTEWEDCKARLRRWFPLEEALRLLAVHKPVQCTYITLMIQTSSTLQQSAPHLLTLATSLVKQQQQQGTTMTTFQPPNSGSLLSDGGPGPGPGPGPGSGADDAVDGVTSSTDNPPTTTTTTTSEQRYLQVNHYPSGSGNGNNGNNSSSSSGSSPANAHFNAFICSRGVYSTDSETAEELVVGGSSASTNHRGSSEGGGGSENGNSKTTEAMLSPPQQQQTPPMAESSVNS